MEALVVSECWCVLVSPLLHPHPEVVELSMSLLLLLVAVLLLQLVLHLLQELQEMRLLVLLKISALVEERLQRDVCVRQLSGPSAAVKTEETLSDPLRDAKAEDINTHILKTRFSSETVASLHKDEGLDTQNTQMPFTGFWF